MPIRLSTNARMIETKKDGELDFGVYEREVFSPLVSPAQTISAGQHVKKIPARPKARKKQQAAVTDDTQRL